MCQRVNRGERRVSAGISRAVPCTWHSLVEHGPLSCECAEHGGRYLLPMLDGEP
jgi:hypothetical protein